MSDGSILARIAGGDRSAVADCLDRYGALVWSLAKQKLPTLADAEDAVQDIFVELWQKADRFDSRLSSEATFIVMVARRRLIDRQRRRARKPLHASLENEQLNVPDRLRAVGTYAEIDEEAARAKECLQELKTDERRVIEMAVYHGLSQSTISEKTGIPLGTVKTHARRGLLKLRELMAKTAVAGKGGVA